MNVGIDIKKYFAAKSNRTKITDEDIKILNKRVKTYKIVLYFLILFFCFSLINVITYDNITTDKMFIWNSLNCMTSGMLFFCFIPVTIYLRHQAKKILKSKHVNVVIGVLEEVDYAGRSRAPYFRIGGSPYKVAIWHTWRFKPGMCLEIRYVRDYFISIKRYNDKMYDVEQIVERDKEEWEAFKLSLDLMEEQLKKSIAEDDAEEKRKVPRTGAVKKKNSSKIKEKK